MPGESSLILPLSLPLLGDSDPLPAVVCGKVEPVISESTEVLLLDIFISTSGLDDLDLVSRDPALPVTFEAGAGLSTDLEAVVVTGEFSISIVTMLLVFVGETDGNFLCTAEPERGRDIVTLEVLLSGAAVLPEEEASLPSSDIRGTLEGRGCIA